MTEMGGLVLKVSDDDPEVGYVSMPGHSTVPPGAVKRTVNLRELLGSYSGPDVNLDFGEGNILLGIEIVG